MVSNEFLISYMLEYLHRARGLTWQFLFLGGRCHNHEGESQKNSSVETYACSSSYFFTLFLHK